VPPNPQLAVAIHLSDAYELFANGNTLDSVRSATASAVGHPFSRRAFEAKAFIGVTAAGKPIFDPDYSGDRLSGAYQPNSRRPGDFRYPAQFPHSRYYYALRMRATGQSEARRHGPARFESLFCG
jgi:hypothetical protein